MPEYRRAWSPGGTFFFTLVTYNRQPIFQDEGARRILREAFAIGAEKVGPFQIDALCLLPEHLHCTWTLPENDGDNSNRWKVIKSYFSHRYIREGGIPGSRTTSKFRKGELGVWQRRFWEHEIRDVEDYRGHLDYIHYNPVKHGLVDVVRAWPWSTFHRYVEEGYYDLEWGSGDTEIAKITFEE